MPVRGQRLVRKFRGAARQRLKNLEHYQTVALGMNTKNPGWALFVGADLVTMLASREIVRNALALKVPV